MHDSIKPWSKGHGINAIIMSSCTTTSESSDEIYNKEVDWTCTTNKSNSSDSIDGTRSTVRKLG